MLLFLAAFTPSNALDEAIAASGRPLNVAVFVNTRTDQCHSRGYKSAIERLTKLAEADVNKRAGASRRPINVKFFDNQASPEVAIKNIEEAFKGEELLAMVGLSSSQRSKIIFGKIGDKIGASGVPLITRMSVGDVFQEHKNVFSASPSQEIERIPVMVKFINANGIKSLSFLGRKDRKTGRSAYIEAIGNGLHKQTGNIPFVDLPRVTREEDEKNDKQWLNKDELAQAVAELKANTPEMLVIAVGSSQTHQVLKALTKANVKPPLFVAGRFTGKLIRAAKDYPHPIYGITFSDVPEVVNDRIFNVLSKGEPDQWLFEGEKVAGYKGQCDKEHARGTYTKANLRAVSRGAQFADMVRLVAASAAKIGHMKDIKEYRRQVIKDLTKTYAAGRGAFKGTFENWSFHPKTRVRAKTPFVIILPTNLGRTQLTQQQYLRLPEKNVRTDKTKEVDETEKLKQIETLYLDIDLIRTHSVDNNKKSFFAEFYLAMRRSECLQRPTEPAATPTPQESTEATAANAANSQPAPKNDKRGCIGIEDLNFTNAFLDPRAGRSGFTNGRELTIEELYGGGKTDTWPADMRVYKIAGRFRFTPDFSNFPFDRQQFSIDLQPKSSDETFIIQPPPTALRDANVDSDGWLPDQHYVAYVEDYVPVVDAFTHNPSVVPFYRTRFVWQMTRETTDYYIRVVVPLLFILIVAYLSIFIPKSHLESIVTIQITALLAAVALYLSLPQIDTDTATISDRIFMVDYMMVSVMIAVSILRINARVVATPWINNLLAFIHIVIIPAALLVLVLYNSKTELLLGFMELPGWRLLGLG